MNLIVDTSQSPCGGQKVQIFLYTGARGVENDCDVQCWNIKHMRIFMQGQMTLQAFLKTRGARLKTSC